MTARSSPTVAILGGSISGNKGAASMVYGVCDGLAERVPAAHFVIFSPYPDEDRRQQPDLEVVDFTPRAMLESLPWALLALASGRRLRPRRGPAGMLARADVVADVSGIAFMDGRGVVTLVYNALLVLIPWALGVPVVKIAQALGPFESMLNRLVAKLVLSRVRWIGLRGASTADNVRALGSLPAERASDVSFLLGVGSADAEAATAELPEVHRFTLLAPSAVVEEASRMEGIDYVGRMQDLVQRLSQAGHEVVLVAHSARADAPPGHTNDLPLCRRIAASGPARLIDREIDAREMRALIGCSRLLVTSRFHAMISGLATCTPTFVVGWSHKYREVLAEFGMAEWAVDFRDLTEDALFASIQRLDGEAEAVRNAIQSHLDAVVADARRNIEGLLSVYEKEPI